MYCRLRFSNQSLLKKLGSRRLHVATSSQERNAKCLSVVILFKLFMWRKVVLGKRVPLPAESTLASI